MIIVSVGRNIVSIISTFFKDHISDIVSWAPFRWRTFHSARTFTILAFVKVSIKAPSADCIARCTRQQENQLTSITPKKSITLVSGHHESLCHLYNPFHRSCSRLRVLPLIWLYCSLASAKELSERYTFISCMQIKYPLDLPIHCKRVRLFFCYEIGLLGPHLWLEYQCACNIGSKYLLIAPDSDMRYVICLCT